MNSPIRTFVCAVCLAIAAFPASSVAALTAYMTVQGATQGDIQGDCDQAGRENTHIVYERNHLIGSMVDSATGLPTGELKHHPYVVRKKNNQGSPLLYQAMATGEVLQVVIDVYRITEMGKEEKYFTYRLNNARIVDIHSTTLHVVLDENKARPDEEVVAFVYESIVIRNNILGTEATIVVSP
ncbi:MAG: type VI secretion system tube protein Hcp [Chitinivibrionales bacterium]|nr:type VI secretion system tube protein Hcp [Chitinivibrionales bacterium]